MKLNVIWLVDICVCGKTMVMAKEIKHKIQTVLAFWGCDWDEYEFSLLLVIFQIEM